MSLRLPGLLALLLLSACAAPSESDDEDVSGDEAAILGGGIERGYPSVGALVKPAPGGINIGSGTLIAPDLVLTAAHVASMGPVTFYYGLPPAGKDPKHIYLRSVEVDSVIVHPCYHRHPLDSCPGPSSEPIDVALVKLKTPIRDVAPTPIIDEPLRYLWGLISPYEDDSCVAVGFGAHLDDQGKASMAMRRSARAKVDDVGETELVTVRDTGIATGGDSGGPLLCSGKIIGTVRGSAGAVPKTSPLERTREAYERIDLHRAWIKAQIAGR